MEPRVCGLRRHSTVILHFVQALYREAQKQKIRARNPSSNGVTSLDFYVQLAPYKLVTKSPPKLTLLGAFFGFV